MITPLLAVVPGHPWADDDCLAEVKALRSVLADDSRLLAQARGVLDRADELCRTGEVAEARLLLEELRRRAGRAMGQGQ